MTPLAYPEVRFSTSPSMTAVCAARRGAYSGIGDTLASLSRWLESKGVEPAGDPFCLFYDNPGETPEDELRSEACVPVASPVQGTGEFRTKEFPAAKVAETSHPGPQQDFPWTYGPFLEGLLKLGFVIDGPAREYFRKASDVKGPGSGYLIQQPVSK